MFATNSCVQKVRACTRRTAGVLGKLFAEFHCGSLRGHPLPLPLGEVPEHGEGGEGKQFDLIIQSGAFPTLPR